MVDEVQPTNHSSVNVTKSEKNTRPTIVTIEYYTFPISHWTLFLNCYPINLIGHGRILYLWLGFVGETEVYRILLKAIHDLPRVQTVL